MPLSIRQSTELFHLVFLRALIAKGDDKGLIALKGGCNLRFFFGSIRYSEDMDLDVVVIARDTLKNKVERLLKSPMVLTPLRAHGITLVETSAPKQTDTTQRWKVGLLRQGDELPLRTKVEFSTTGVLASGDPQRSGRSPRERRGARGEPTQFSRRDAIEGTKFEPTDREVLRPYGMTPLLATHYTTATAIRQKIHALAGRVEPQARDVFDLSHLLARVDASHLAIDEEAHGWVPAAIENAIGLSFDEYTSKVVAFLDPEHADVYADRSAWESMQEDVVARLEALR